MSNPDGLAGLSTEELRIAVRAVLRDVLPDLGIAPTPSSGEQATEDEEVVLRTNGDLDAFVRRLAALCADPVRRAALQDGRHGFRLSTAAGSQPDGVVRVERGAVTERTVNRVAADGARLVLGPGAVLTPLARDKARSLGVSVEKERS
jgi:hypothetical protein